MEKVTFPPVSIHDEAKKFTTAVAINCSSGVLCAFWAPLHLDQAHPLNVVYVLQFCSILYVTSYPTRLV